MNFINIQDKISQKNPHLKTINFPGVKDFNINIQPQSVSHQNCENYRP